MNIAVIFTKNKQEGGAFQYALSLSLLLSKNKSSEYNFIFFTTVKENRAIFKKYNLNFLYLRWINIDRLFSLISNSWILSSFFAKARLRIESKFDRIMKKHNIDLVYFLNPSDLALAASGFNYIFTIWDLGFLDFREFPEVFANREFERREYLYHNALRKALKIITDSEFTKKNIINKYCLDESKIITMPLLPSVSMSIAEDEFSKNYISIHDKYNIEGKYIFYPAQFWPHKNHIYILEGLKLLKEKYKIKIHAVFTGSDKGNLNFILRKAKEFNIADQIHHLGFVEDKELPYLYAQALALVMPTYFGPTNIPPLEAFTMGCPVLYSDLEGLREQVEDAAFLLDLKNPDSMCQGLLKVIEKVPEIRRFIENGKRKVECLMQKNYYEELKNIFDDYSLKLKTWK